MFGTVTALEGLHVTGKCSTHAPGMRPGIITGVDGAGGRVKVAARCRRYGYLGSKGT